MFVKDMMARLVSATVVPQASIFYGPKSKPPAGNGPYITLTETGGFEPHRVQNQAPAKYRRPTLQVLVRGAVHDTTRTTADAAYAALDGIFNTVIGTTLYLSVTARQEPTDIGLDDVGRIQFAFNIKAEFAAEA